MQQRHKERLTGAVVIVALAVIFLPMLLRGPVEQRTLDVPVEMPPRPAAETVTRPNPMPGQDPPPVLERIPVPDHPAPSSPDDGQTPDDALAERQVPPEPISERPPDAAPEVEGRGYAVQVGSFRSRDNAVALRDRLRDAGFPAYVEESSTGGGSTVYRLRAGPVVDREEARALAARIADEVELEGIIVSNP